MRLSCCSWGMDQVKKIKEAGFSHAELPLEALTKLPEDDFNALVQTLTDLAYLPKTLCIFFPGDLTLTGPDADFQKILDYTSRALARANKLQTKTVVFGSGRARTLPEGTSHKKGMEQLTELCREIGKIAEENQVTIALEPLNQDETNLINHIKDGYALVEKINHPHIRLLADYYHMGREGDSIEDLYACKDAIVHLHIAHPVTRRYPMKEDGWDYRPFFEFFHSVPGLTMSLEGTSDDFDHDIQESARYLARLDRM